MRSEGSDTCGVAIRMVNVEKMTHYGRQEGSDSHKGLKSSPDSHLQEEMKRSKMILCSSSCS